MQHTMPLNLFKIKCCITFSSWYSWLPTWRFTNLNSLASPFMSSLFKSWGTCHYIHSFISMTSQSRFIIIRPNMEVRKSFIAGIASIVLQRISTRFKNVKFCTFIQRRWWGQVQLWERKAWLGNACSVHPHYVICSVWTNNPTKHIWEVAPSLFSSHSHLLRTVRWPSFTQFLHSWNHTDHPPTKGFAHTRWQSNGLYIYKDKKIC